VIPLAALRINPLEWTSATWALISAALAVLVPLVGWVIKRRVAKRERGRKDHEDAAPQFIFAPTRVFAPGEHERQYFLWAMGFRVENVGPGAATHCLWMYQDPQKEWAAEVVYRAVVRPGASWTGFAGIRHNDDPEVDASERDSHAFLARGRAAVACVDRLDRVHIWTPSGHQLVSDSSRVHMAMLQVLSRYTTRGDAPSGWGAERGE
jgi:hypothetical protein